MDDVLKIAALDAVGDFIRELNEHITSRVRYDRDGPRYAGENEPSQDDVSQAFMAAVTAVVRSAIA